LLDDRDERPGVKFKDADLLGVPLRVTIGNAFVKEGLVEIRERRSRRESRVAKTQVVEDIERMARAG
jgi:prolyl-tRNA synthetase